MSILRRVRPVFAVIAAVLLVAALAPRETAAASCAGKSHEMALSNGTVSPGSGTTADRFAFAVTYTDNDGCAPDRIVVAIVGVGEFALSRIRGDLQTGATFGRSMKLPAGDWRYRFEASSGSGVGLRTFTLTTVYPSRVQVVAPTPRPTAGSTPSPTPAATPKPTRRPKPASSTTPSPSSAPETQTPSAAPASPAPAAAAGPVGTPHAGAAAPVAPFDVGRLPRPILAVIVSSVGTLVGLALFAVLGTRLLHPSPEPDVGALGRGRPGQRPSGPGS
jgi:hypothetical protein